MQFARESAQRHAIQKYNLTTVTIAEQTYEGSLAISAETLLEDWQCTSIEALSDTLIDRLVALNPEVIILATGATVVFPNAALLHPVMRSGIGIEVMNDGAAIRTFNVLLSESRQVVLALIRG
ncbi:MAG: MTH938/NDUFAF3 family protein [Pseudomonadota bacterium]